MKYYILNTKKESDECRLECYRALLENNKSERFAELTVEWSSEQTRLTDEKYIVPECPYITQHNYVIEEFQSDWVDLTANIN